MSDEKYTLARLQEGSGGAKHLIQVVENVTREQAIANMELGQNTGTFFLFKEAERFEVSHATKKLVTPLEKEAPHA